MAQIPHSVVVSQSGGDLDITAGDYELVIWNPPALEYRVHEVQGRYQAGSRLVSAVPDVATIGGVFRCKGAAWTAVDAAIADLYAALGQFEYTVTTTLDGVVETFENCQPASVRPLGGRRTSGEIASGFADFDVAIRCTPNIA